MKKITMLLILGFAAPAAATELGDVVGAVAGIAGTAASGGVLGLAGSALGGVFKWLNAKAELAQQARLWAHEIELQKLQLQARAEETEQEMALAAQAGSWQALDSSITADAATATTAPPWAAAIKTLFRPFLTLLLLTLSAAIIFMLLEGKLPALIGATTTESLVTYAVQTIIFSTSTAIVWWFGDRSFAPPRTK